jgi:hypothetical protein
MSAMNAFDSGLGHPRTGFAALRSIVVVLAVAAVTGCMTAKVDETRQAASAVQSGESIVVLKRPQLEGAGTEEAFVDCLQERLGGELVHPEAGQTTRSPKGSTAPFKIYGEQQFIDAMFPWFEASTAPNNAAGLKVLLQRPGVTERLQQISVRYIVWIDGKTQTTDSNGSVACGVGPAGGGCIGLGWWDKQSGYVASVWDLNTAMEIGSVSADVTGTSVLIGAIVPIPIIAPVRHSACDRLGDQLRSFLVGSNAPAVGNVASSEAAKGSSAGSR